MRARAVRPRSSTCAAARRTIGAEHERRRRPDPPAGAEPRGGRHGARYVARQLRTSCAADDQTGPARADAAGADPRARALARWECRADRGVMPYAGRDKWAGAAPTARPVAHD